MGNKLSHTLLDLGFFSALGTIEHDAGRPDHVPRGKDNTFDSNNGVTVVYDEVGRPWIIQTSRFTAEVSTALNREFSLQRGAYVPHSNDGGHFVREIVAKF